MSSFTRRVAVALMLRIAKVATSPARVTYLEAIVLLVLLVVFLSFGTLLDQVLLQ